MANKESESEILKLLRYTSMAVALIGAIGIFTFFLAKNYLETKYNSENVNAIKTDLSHIRLDVSDLKKDVAVLKEDVYEIKVRLQGQVEPASSSSLISS